MAQEANALGNARDMLTWAGYSGRQGASRCQGFMTRGISRSESEYTKKASAKPLQLERFSRYGADDNSLST